MKKIFLFILSLTLLGTLIFSTYKMINWVNDNKKIENEIKKVKD